MSTFPAGTQGWPVEEQRKAAAVAKKYVDRVVVVLHAADTERSLHMSKRKFICPRNLKMSELVSVIRRSQRVKISAEQALFLFVNGALVPMSEELDSVHARHADGDGVLHVSFASENTFGFWGGVR